ncbi:MAG: prepilin peptidase [Candidatus Eremiobacteraeota bacterium]|nr:prepilin peptidase [Candidatus Eremiobacteraeota bacterium]
MNDHARALTVACGLILWGFIAIALSRRAETSATDAVLPLPWASATCVLGLAAISVIFRSPLAAATCGAACIGLAAAAAADLRTGYLFDALTMPAAALVTALAIGGGATDRACAGVLMVIGPFGALVVYSRGRWMGLGDVKAMYALAVAFGPIESFLAIFVACVCAIASVIVAGRFAARCEIRFGPYLAVGAAFALVAGDQFSWRIAGA